MSDDPIAEDVLIWTCPKHGHRAFHPTDTCPQCGPVVSGFLTARVSRRFVAADTTCAKCQEPTEDYVLCPACGSVKR